MRHGWQADNQTISQERDTDLITHNGSAVTGRQHLLLIETARHRWLPALPAIEVRCGSLSSMFIGHFGVALAAKRWAPRTSLGTLFFAAEFLDLIWPVFLLLGLEHVRVAPGITKMQPFDFYDYPISHSLVIAIVWGAVVAGVYFAVRRYRAGTIALGILVVSHWVLDFIVHRPDMPLWPGGGKVGLGLWNSWPAGITVEVLTFGIGIALYLGATRTRDAVGTYGLWSILAVLFFGWLSFLFGPAPPDTKSLALGSMALWIALPWGWWADKHRMSSP